ncbi:hypothetical protein Sjap_001755 [Stephania japonica]|uniref:Prenyltransferase alpha-alpha toroid domain-containing protein n=1 Tax=Stephania japonica TaxID=461633 RepID=A0AAP0KN44_9MAGN
MDSERDSQFDRDRHLWFLELMHCDLPSEYQAQEINRLTLAYFVVSSFTILRALDRIDKEQVASWVLSFQARPRDDENLENGKFYGFYGSRSTQFSADNSKELLHHGGHLASTYCALAILKMIGYDLQCIERESILVSMRNLQQPDGSLMPIDTGAENDLRFVFCAGRNIRMTLTAICFMLSDWSGMDREKAKEFILNCQSYDGGFGLVPGSESHGVLSVHLCLSGTGGATYCAVAALNLMGFIEDDLLFTSASPSLMNVQLLLEWCLQRLNADGGFQGRPNKNSDTCYAFWIGGTLKILGGLDFIDKGALREFLFTCQSQYGGFSKFPRHLPDLYHSYYGFCAFSLLEEPGLNPLCVELGMADVAALGI